MSEVENTTLEIDHNVYILGAGFSVEAGYPLVRNFMDLMREAYLTKKEESDRKSLKKVLNFRQKVSSAAYRTIFDPENIEDLFSLATATQNDKSDMAIAIAETLSHCKNKRIDKALSFPVLLKEGETIIGFDQNNMIGEPKYPIIDRFKLYAGIMAGKWGNTSMGSNSFITFNYDLVLEEAFQLFKIPFRYDGLPEPYEGLLRAMGFGFDLIYHDLPNTFVTDSKQNDAVSLIKLHGSINWAVDYTKKNGKPKEFHIYSSYTDSLAHDIRESSDTFVQDKELVLIPPVWDKGTTHGENPLFRMWSQAIKKLRTATRIIVIGYSLPPTDAHFRYLLAAGLQENISLKKIVFVDPGLKEGDPNRPLLEERIFGIFRKELMEKGILEFIGLEANEFFTNQKDSRKHENILNRKFPPLPHYWES